MLFIQVLILGNRYEFQLKQGHAHFVCVEVKKNKLTLFLKINPKETKLPQNGRDVSEIGHYGTGDFELNISSKEEFEESKEYIKRAFETIGG